MIHHGLYCVSLYISRPSVAWCLTALDWLISNKFSWKCQTPPTSQRTSEQSTKTQTGSTDHLTGSTQRENKKIEKRISATSMEKQLRAGQILLKSGMIQQKQNAFHYPSACRDRTWQTDRETKQSCRCHSQQTQEHFVVTQMKASTAAELFFFLSAWMEYVSSPLQPLFIQARVFGNDSGSVCQTVRGWVTLIVKTRCRLSLIKLKVLLIFRNRACWDLKGWKRGL